MSRCCIKNDAYCVEIDIQALVKNCVRNLRDMPPISILERPVFTTPSASCVPRISNPERFKIETPIGTYNPDWAVYLTRNGEEKLYFVVETKGSLDPFDRRGYENLKIHCGKQHFKALEAGVDMQAAASWPEFKKRM